jgi:dienelactone hydrolase
MGRVALLAAIAALLCVLAWPVVRAHLEAVAVLDQVSGDPVPRVVGELVAHPISVEEIAVPAAVGTARARIYLPTDMPQAPAMIVLHGVHHLGIDEPRLESFAAAMASSGLQVLTPELPDIKDYQIGPASIRTIGESAKWFSERTGGAPVGVMGLSFSGGLALLVAADPAYAPSIRFVFAVGSQASMPRVAKYYRTGKDLRPDGTVEALAAHEYGPLVLEYEHVEDFAPEADVTALRAVLRAHLYEDGPAEKLATDALSSAQRTLATRLMTVSDPATQAALAASEVKHDGEMMALSPAGRLKDMRIPVYLLHGEADNVIPAAETLWLSHELPSERLGGMLVSPMLSHVDMKKSPGAMDQWRLVHLMAQVLRATGKK